MEVETGAGMDTDAECARREQEVRLLLESNSQLRIALREKGLDTGDISNWTSVEVTIAFHVAETFVEKLSLLATESDISSRDFDWRDYDSVDSKSSEVLRVKDKRLKGLQQQLDYIKSKHGARPGASDDWQGVAESREREELNRLRKHCLEKERKLQGMMTDSLRGLESRSDAGPASDTSRDSCFNIFALFGLQACASERSPVDKDVSAKTLKKTDRSHPDVQ